MPQTPVGNTAMNVNTGSYQMLPDRSSCLGSSVNGLMVWQIHEDSCLAFCKTRTPYSPTLIAWTGPYWPSWIARPDPYWQFLNCTKGFVLTHLNGSYGAVLSHLRVPIQSGLTRFPQLGISSVPGLLCKKRNNNKKRVWNRMAHP